MDTLIMLGFTVWVGLMALRDMSRKAFVVVWVVAMIALLLTLNYHMTDELGLTGL